MASVKIACIGKDDVVCFPPQISDVNYFLPVCAFPYFETLLDILG